MRPAAGTLNQRITIDRATTTQDAAGQPVRSWSPLVSHLPAKVEQASGGEILRGRQLAAQTRWVFTVRHRGDVTPAMRVRHGVQTLGIVRVGDPYGDQSELRIECLNIE